MFQFDEKSIKIYLTCCEVDAKNIRLYAFEKLTVFQIM